MQARSDGCSHILWAQRFLQLHGPPHIEGKDTILCCSSCVALIVAHSTVLNAWLSAGCCARFDRMRIEVRCHCGTGSPIMAPGSRGRERGCSEEQEALSRQGHRPGPRCHQALRQVSRSLGYMSVECCGHQNILLDRIVWFRLLGTAKGAVFDRF